MGSQVLDGNYRHLSSKQKLRKCVLYVCSAFLECFKMWDCKDVTAARTHRVVRTAIDLRVFQSVTGSVYEDGEHVIRDS
jgi:hypothetical protein